MRSRITPPTASVEPEIIYCGVTLDIIDSLGGDVGAAMDVRTPAFLINSEESGNLRPEPWMDLLALGEGQEVLLFVEPSPVDGSALSTLSNLHSVARMDDGIVTATGADDQLAREWNLEHALEPLIGLSTAEVWQELCKPTSLSDAVTSTSVSAADACKPAG